MLVITGGEPFLWEDREHRLGDVVQYAKEKGYFRIVVCTNGVFPLESKADYLWVSLDGTSRNHNELRKSTLFDQIVRNLTESSHSRIYVNFTINALNSGVLEQEVEAILGLPNVRGVLLLLFTPYRGLEDSPVRLDPMQKKETLRKMQLLKRRHPFRITNSFAGIRALTRNTWRRPVWGSTVANGGELSTCCCREGIYDTEVCRECGCTPAVETWVLQSMKPSALLEYLRYL